MRGVRDVCSCAPFLGGKRTLCGVERLGNLGSVERLGRFIRRENPRQPPHPSTKATHHSAGCGRAKPLPIPREVGYLPPKHPPRRRREEPPPTPASLQKKPPTIARVVGARNPRQPPQKSRGMSGVRSKCGESIGRKRNFLWLSLLRFAKNLYICTIVHIYIRYKILKI